jgi:hypothetical protein
MSRLVCLLTVLMLLVPVVPAHMQDIPTPDLQPIPGKALLPNQPIRIQMTGDGGLDLVYYAAEAGTVSIYARSMDHNDIPVDTVLDVFDVDGSPLSSNDDLNTNSSDAGIENLVISAPGAYRIHLGTFAADETGAVEVELVTGSAPPPNQGDEITGRIENAQPFEYTFQGQAGQTEQEGCAHSGSGGGPPDPGTPLPGPFEQRIQRNGCGGCAGRVGTAQGRGLRPGDSRQCPGR